MTTSPMTPCGTRPTKPESKPVTEAPASRSPGDTTINQWVDELNQITRRFGISDISRVPGEIGDKTPNRAIDELNQISRRCGLSEISPFLTEAKPSDESKPLTMAEAIAELEPMAIRLTQRELDHLNSWLNERINDHELIADAEVRAKVAEIKAGLRAQVKPTRAVTGARRTKADIDHIRDAIKTLLIEDRPMTCRQLFYRLVAAGVIGKTEKEYKATVVRLLGNMRREGAVPYGWIADSTRWVRQPQMHGSIGTLLDDMKTLYRRDLWRDQHVYVEVWCEKDAIAGVLYDVTSKFGVPLMVTRGYSSLSFLHSAGETLQAIAETTGKTCYLYQFGDHDPSGVDIGRRTEAELGRFAPSASICFDRIAVTPEQVEDWKIPTRPTKRTDSRSKNFKGESVDVDAIHPRDLRELCEECITRHIDKRQWEASLAVEEAERETLKQIASAGFA